MYERSASNRAGRNRADRFLFQMIIKYRFYTPERDLM